ncbi:hypothetical protein [Agromyces humi]|uniref:hypothetical protein n=1 Tax=Agromyces humi TaxID=1766800 RepID=UPI001358ECB4|nr:hypothetical protein [Agromyces humi]
MTQRGARARRKIMISVAAAIVCGSVIVAAPATGFGSGTHRQNTADGLGIERAGGYDRFISDGVLDAIDYGHVWADEGLREGYDQYHFDDCEFDEGASNIMHQYAGAKLALEDYDLFRAYWDFGVALHGAQDFYSHSNWVELGFPLNDDPTTQRVEVEAADLVNISGAPTLSKPWSARNGLTVRSGIMLANDDWGGIASGTLTRDGFVRTWAKEGGAQVRLLESGTGSADHECTIPYYKASNGMGFVSGFTHNDLAKDSPGSSENSVAKFERARALAVLQTGYEWCRLVQFAGEERRAGLLLALSVRPGVSPHPANTPCAPREPSVAVNQRPVTVTITSIQVKDDGDPDDEAAEVQVAAVLFNSASQFRQSAHSWTGPTPIGLEDGDSIPRSRLPAPLTLCGPASEEFQFGVYGWDNDDADGKYPESFDIGRQREGFGDDSYADDVLIGGERSVPVGVQAVTPGRFVADELVVEYEVAPATNVRCGGFF